MNSIQPLENASQFFFSPNLVNLSKLEKKGPFFCWLSFTVSSMRRALCTMAMITPLPLTILFLFLSLRNPQEVARGELDSALAPYPDGCKVGKAYEHRSCLHSESLFFFSNPVCSGFDEVIANFRCTMHLEYRRPLMISF
ncbi:hypothetical protein Peur_036358 [Populus x canadensis]